MAAWRGEFLMKWIAVSNRKLCGFPLPVQVQRLGALAQDKPAALILREKDLSEMEYEALGWQVMASCREADITCIFHYYIEAARRLGGTRIHLPMSVFMEHSSRLEDFERVGVSIHSVEDALAACRLGASYLTFGHVFSTDCKPGLLPRGPEMLREVCAAVARHYPLVSVYAIGGICRENAQLCIAQGATGVCLMSEAMRV